MTDLTGKVIIVTGAAGNLGGCMAKLMSDRGGDAHPLRHRRGGGGEAA